MPMSFLQRTKSYQNITLERELMKKATIKYINEFTDQMSVFKNWAHSAKPEDKLAFSIFMLQKQVEELTDLLTDVFSSDGAITNYFTKQEN